MIDKCPICGSRLQYVEVTDEEETEKQGKWVTKFIGPLCKNHNHFLLFKSDLDVQKIIEHYVKMINKGELTVKRKNKFFLENKEALGITRY